MPNKFYVFLFICAVPLNPPALACSKGHPRDNAFIGYSENTDTYTDALREGVCREYARSVMCNTGSWLAVRVNATIRITSHQ